MLAQGGTLASRPGAHNTCALGQRSLGEALASCTASQLAKNKDKGRKLREKGMGKKEKARDIF